MMKNELFLGPTTHRLLLSEKKKRKNTEDMGLKEYAPLSQTPTPCTRELLQLSTWKKFSEKRKEKKRDR